MTLLEQRRSSEVRTGTDIEVLFKEARRRRRRIRVLWVAIALGALGCAVGAGFGLSVRSGPTGPPVPRGGSAHPPGSLHTSVTLVYALNDLRVIDADTGSTRALPMPAPYGGSRDLGMVHVGGSLLLNRGDTAWLYSAGVTGSPTDLGRSDGVFPGPTRNEAWIWSQPCRPVLGCTNYNAPQMGSVQLVDSAGANIGSPVQLPGGAGWYPTASAGRVGFVLSELPPYSNGKDKEEIWNPLTDHVVRVSSAADVIGAAGDLVVSESKRYCSGEFLACPVQVTDFQTGTEETVHLPKGVSVDGGVAISPNQRTIALAASLSRSARSPYPKAIALIDVRTGVATILPGSEQPTKPSGGPMSLTWSTNGWLFSDTVGTTAVLAWHPGESRARVLPRVRLPEVQLVNEDPSLFAL